MSGSQGSQLNAKQRRLLRRAQARTQGEENTEQDKKEAGKPQEPASSVSKEAGLNAKQRRLSRRAQEREQQKIQEGRGQQPQESRPDPAEQLEQPPSGADSSARAAGSGAGRKRKRSDVIPHVVFVGQLSYKTTAESIVEHFRSQGVEGDIKVRLLTDKAKGTSKGQAFVELDSAANQYKCLALHHTRLDGRQINVERTCGGKAADTRKKRLEHYRSEQEQVLTATRDRIVNEKIDQGLLKKDELDEQAMQLLVRHDGRTMDAILTAYCAEERSKLRNPSAFFMKLAKTCVDEGVEKFVAKQTASGDDAKKGQPKVFKHKRLKQDRTETGLQQGAEPRDPSGQDEIGQEDATPREAQENGDKALRAEHEEEEEMRGWTLDGEAMELPDIATQHEGDGYDLRRVFRSLRGRGGSVRAMGSGRGRRGRMRG